MDIIGARTVIELVRDGERSTQGQLDFGAFKATVIQRIDSLVKGKPRSNKGITDTERDRRH
jgi:hypothetical protein